MKKLITSISAILLFSMVSHNLKAQEIGDSRLHVGVGIGGFGINADYERIIIDNIGVGVYGAVTRRTYGALLLGSTGYNRTEINFGVRGAYHFNELLNIPEKYDVYAAAGAGVELYKYSDSFYDDGTRLRPQLIARVGGAMKFSDKMGFFAEVGQGPSYLSGGIRLGM